MAKKNIGRPSGPNLRKLQPKLRMIANGSETVNCIRAEWAGAIAVDDQSAAGQKLLRMNVQRTQSAAPRALAPAAAKVRKPKLNKVPRDVLANVFIETTEAPRTGGNGSAAKRRGKNARGANGDGDGDGNVAGVESCRGRPARKGNLAVATVRLSELQKMIERPEVAYVELGEAMAEPAPIVAARKPAEPARPAFKLPRKPQTDVLIGIIDVQGFDFAHEDFLDASGQTRFVAIWDQGGDVRPNPAENRLGDPRYAQFGYGAEFTGAQLNAAIATAKAAGAPATRLEPQSQMEPGSHATHVAGIAAGDHGVCPRAKIAGVLIALTKSDADRRSSFYDSTRIAHAVDYLVNLAEDLGIPVSINISLGTNGHAHDASAACSRWIDAALAVPGRSVCVAAGNAGQEIAEFPGDIGYVMGRIHTSGKLPSRELTRDIEWVVVGNGRLDLSENELELWYSPQDRLAVSLRPPKTDDEPAPPWIGPIRPGEFMENEPLADGTFVSIYNELYHPANGANYIAVYLSPYFSNDAVIGVTSGTWTVRLHGVEVREGSYHGWIERDDPRRLGRIGEREAWRFPSFFTESSNVDDSSISSLACGQRVVSVANLDAARERIHITSSQGPTRDNRCKPDVAAPGTGIVAANGFAGPDDPWIEMTGTSMASPYVAGVIGLMLSIEPKLTAAQVNGIIQRTANPLPGADFTWRNAAGYGRVNVSACLEEAASVNRRVDKTSKK